MREIKSREEWYKVKYITYNLNDILEDKIEELAKKVVDLLEEKKEEEMQKKYIKK